MVGCSLVQTENNRLFGIRLNGSSTDYQGIYVLILNLVTESISFSNSHSSSYLHRQLRHIAS